jgi:hypothetical protein
MAILPPKVLMVSLNTINIYSTWSNPGDPYDGFPYQWSVEMNVSQQSHSNPNTTTPYAYNSQDVKVGDWLASSIDGVSFEIIQITDNSNPNYMTVILEDIELFNTYNDPTGQGAGGPIQGQSVIFEMNNVGDPILMGVESGAVPDTFVTDLISRFEYRNLLQKFIRVNQPGHTFAIGNIIQPNVSVTGAYMLATDTSGNNLTVGTVSDSGTPSPDWFNFEPFGEVVYNVTPSLTGSYGTLFYMDPSHPGLVTSVRPTEFARPIYLQLSSSTTAIRFSAAEEQASETKTYTFPSIADNQTTFTLPSDTFEVISMMINGIETVNFTYVNSTLTLTFDPVGNGYGVDSTDEVTFVYTT